MSSARHGPAQDWSSSAEASPEGGRPSVFSCPECHGVLSKTGPDDLPRFVCRVGHAHDPESLLSEQATDTEKAIWSAVRALEERASFARKLELRARGLGDHAAERQFADHATEAERQAAVVRAATSVDVAAARTKPGGDPPPSHDSE